MCRSIRTLRPPAQPDVTTGDVEAAARQYVRKISGFREPAVHNRDVFEAAVASITAATRELVEAIEVRGQDPVEVVPGPSRKPPSRPRRD